jgi:hypothetical protein
VPSRPSYLESQVAWRVCTLNLNLEIDERLVARIDAIASVQKTSREQSVVAALQCWYAHQREIDFGDFVIHRAGPELTPDFKELPPDTQRDLVGERLP